LHLCLLSLFYFTYGVSITGSNHNSADIVHPETCISFSTYFIIKWHLHSKLRYVGFTFIVNVIRLVWKSLPHTQTQPLGLCCPMCQIARNLRFIIQLHLTLRWNRIWDLSPNVHITIWCEPGEGNCARGQCTGIIQQDLVLTFSRYLILIICTSAENKEQRIK
jgi:hypothetical protein